MTITELRYVVMLAQERHFGRAAQRCHVSQPTLSIGLKKLEKELGAVLFERTPTGVRTTPAGERVVNGARLLLEQAARIEDEARQGRDPLMGPLALGVLPSIAPYLLPQCIPVLQRTARQMPLYVEESDAASLMGRLRNGDLDVVVAAQPFTAPEVVVQILHSEPFVVLLPARHRLASREFLTVTDLEDERVLMSAPGCDLRDQVLSCLPSLNRLTGSGPGAFQVNGSTLDALRHMVASGLGVTVVPAMAARCTFYSAEVLAIRPFAAPVPGRTLVLAWRASFPRHGAVEALRTAIMAGCNTFWTGGTQANFDSAVLVDNKEW